MILQMFYTEKGYAFQLMEDLNFHPLEDATKEDLVEYKEYLVDQIKIIEDILL